MGKQTIIGKIQKRIRLTIHRSLPPCKDIVRIISASLDRPLTLRERIVMRLHLAACKPCNRYLEQSEFLHQATHELDDKLKEDVYAGRLSDEARARIKKALNSSI